MTKSFKLGSFEFLEAIAWSLGFRNLNAPNRLDSTTHCARFIKVKTFIKWWCWSHSLFQAGAHVVLYIIIIKLTKVILSVIYEKRAFVVVRIRRIVNGTEFLASKFTPQVVMTFDGIVVSVITLFSQEVFTGSFGMPILIEKLNTLSLKVLLCNSLDNHKITIINQRKMVRYAQNLLSYSQEQLLCSPDPTTNSETTISEFSNNYRTF